MVQGNNFLDAINSKVYDINGKIITEFYQENRNPVPLSNIPLNLINATIAIEDSDFYQHKGISLRGIIRAQWVNFKNIVIGLKKEAKIAGQIADQRAKADKVERALIVERAKANRDRAELLDKAAQKEKFNASERIGFLEEAARIDVSFALKHDFKKGHPFYK